MISEYTLADSQRRESALVGHVRKAKTPKDRLQFDPELSTELPDQTIPQLAPLPSRFDDDDETLRSRADGKKADPKFLQRKTLLLGKRTSLGRRFDAIAALRV